MGSNPRLTDYVDVACSETGEAIANWFPSKERVVLERLDNYIGIAESTNSQAARKTLKSLLIDLIAEYHCQHKQRGELWKSLPEVKPTEGLGLADAVSIVRQFIKDINARQ